MSYVYEGVHVTSGQLGAVKLLRPEFCQNRKTVRRFEQEARLAGQLNHNNIVRVLDFDRDDDNGWFFLVLELLSGRDLSSLMPEAPFPSKWIRALVEQVCSALSKTHEQGIIHRDLKPSNIFLLPRRPFPQVKLLDFGVAKLIFQKMEQQITRTGEIIGTPAYVAPEQFLPNQPLTQSADIYALGVMLYQLFAGELPIDGGSAIAHAVLVMQQEAPLIGEAREEFKGTKLEALLERLLSKLPEDRPSTMPETWEALAEAFDDLKDPLDEDAVFPLISPMIGGAGPRTSPLGAELSDQEEEEEPEIPSLLPIPAEALEADKAQREPPTSPGHMTPNDPTPPDPTPPDSGADVADTAMHMGITPEQAAAIDEMGEATFVSEGVEDPGESTLVMESKHQISREELRAAQGFPSDDAEVGEVTMMDEPLPVVMGAVASNTKEPLMEEEGSDFGATLTDGGLEPSSLEHLKPLRPSSLRSSQPTPQPAQTSAGKRANNEHAQRQGRASKDDKPKRAGRNNKAFTTLQLANRKNQQNNKESTAATHSAVATPRPERDKSEPSRLGLRQPQRSPSLLPPANEHPVQSGGIRPEIIGFFTVLGLLGIVVVAVWVLIRYVL